MFGRAPFDECLAADTFSPFLGAASLSSCALVPARRTPGTGLRAGALDRVIFALLHWSKSSLLWSPKKSRVRSSVRPSVSQYGVTQQDIDKIKNRTERTKRFDRASSDRFLTVFFCVKCFLCLWKRCPCPRVPCQTVGATRTPATTCVVGANPGHAYIYLDTYAVVAVTRLRCHTRG